MTREQEIGKACQVCGQTIWDGETPEYPRCCNECEGCDIEPGEETEQ